MTRCPGQECVCRWSLAGPGVRARLEGEAAGGKERYRVEVSDYRRGLLGGNKP